MQRPSLRAVWKSERQRWLLRVLLLPLLIPIGWGVFQGVRSTRLRYQLVACRDDALVLSGTTSPFTWSTGGLIEAPFPQSVLYEWRWGDGVWHSRFRDETWTGDVFMPEDGQTLLYARPPQSIVLADYALLRPRQVRALGGTDEAAIAGVSANGRYATVMASTAVPGYVTVIDTHTLQDSEPAEMQAGSVDRMGHRIRPCVDAEQVLMFEVGDIENGRHEYQRVPLPAAVDQMMSTYVASMSADRELLYWVNMSRVHSVYADSRWRTVEPSITAVYDHAFHKGRRELAMAGQGAVDLIQCDGVRANQRLVYEGEYFTRVAYSPNGRCVAAISDTGTTVVWDTDRGEIVSEVSLPRRVHSQLAIWLGAATLWCGCWIALSIVERSSWGAALDVTVLGGAAVFSAALAAMLEYVPWYRATASYSATLAGVLLIATTLVLTSWIVGGNGPRFARVAFGLLGLVPLWGGLAVVMKRSPIVENTNIVVYGIAVAVLVNVAIVCLRSCGWMLVDTSESQGTKRMWQWSVREWFLATAVLGGALVACRDLAPPDVPAVLWLLAAWICSAQALIVLAAIWAALADARLSYRALAILLTLLLALLGPLLLPRDPHLPPSWYLAFQGGIGVGVFVMLYLFRMRGFRIRRSRGLGAGEGNESISGTTTETA